MNLRDKVLEYQLNIKDGPAFNSNFKLLLESWEKSAGKSLGERGEKSLKKKTHDPGTPEYSQRRFQR